MSEVGDILQAMAETGPLTASRVVLAATDPSHPLHSRFEWDDGKAAHQYRLIQARTLIVSIQIMPAGASRPIQALIHVPSTRGEGQYVPAQILARQPERWELAKEEVLKYLGAAQDSLEGLMEVAKVFGEQPASRGRRAAKAITRASQEVAAIKA